MHMIRQNNSSIYFEKVFIFDTFNRIMKILSMVNKQCITMVL